ncbi:hypothetical protein M0R04_00520 [Candidatus Dojkabacteria bacterium]|jgi:hypothetical protein|nr:hypothetical protein [Candidatus Dojkabacteria bacterium]
MFKIIAKIGYTVLVLIEATIISRIVILVLNANTSNKIIGYILSISSQLISPFKGILNSEFLQIGGVSLELTSVVALFFYMILAFIAIEIIKAFSNS